jgi:probable rRNA maturation factor
MSRELALRNHQRLRRVNLRLLRQITDTLLADLLGVESCELDIHIVSATRMARINHQFLQHEGSTDVITFDYSASGTRHMLHLNGEIFVCIQDAVAQARRFRTTWQSETVRYIIHGILHLLGYDDSQPVARRKMRVEENSLLRTMTRRFPLSKL